MRDNAGIAESTLSEARAYTKQRNHAGFYNRAPGLPIQLLEPKTSSRGVWRKASLDDTEEHFTSCQHQLQVDL